MHATHTHNVALHIEIQFADNNTIGEPVRDNVIAWNNDSRDGNSWNNTHLWGFLKLAGGPTSVNELVKVSSIRLYPNPARTFINIESTSLINEISVANLLGQTVMRKVSVGEFSTALDISGIQNEGVYFINIITENKRESSRIMIVR